MVEEERTFKRGHKKEICSLESVAPLMEEDFATSVLDGLAIRRVLSKLSQKYKKILLRYLDGFSMTEIAKEMQYSVAEISLCMKAIRKELRAEL